MSYCKLVALTPWDVQHVRRRVCVEGLEVFSDGLHIHIDPTRPVPVEANKLDFDICIHLDLAEVIELASAICRICLRPKLLEFVF
jgi:hypothetical protein